LSFRFIHAADLHLDSPFKGMSSLPAAVRDTIKESTFLALRNLVDLAIAGRVDFVLIAGDVYDMADRSLRAQLRFRKAVEQLAEHKIRVYVAHGNHDPLDGRAAQLTWPETVHFFAGGGVETVTVPNRSGRPVARLRGISYPRAAVVENLAARFPHADDSGLFQIGMLHTNAEGDPDHDNYAPCDLRDLLEKGYDYWALGHIHNRKVLCEAPYVVYPGNLQGRSVRECGPKGVYMVEVDRETYREARLSFHALDAIRWFRQTLTINGMETMQQLHDRIASLISAVRAECGARPAILRLALEGSGPLHAMLHQGTLLSELVDEIRLEQAGLAEARQPFVWIESVELRTVSRQTDPRLLMSERSFAGDLARVAEQLMNDGRALEIFFANAAKPLLAQGRAAKYIGGFGPEERQQLLRAAEMLALDMVAAEEEREP